MCPFDTYVIWYFDFPCKISSHLAKNVCSYIGMSTVFGLFPTFYVIWLQSANYNFYSVCPKIMQLAQKLLIVSLVEPR